mgnify:CR=1 FL=1
MATPLPSTTGPGFPEPGSIHTRHLGTDITASLIVKAAAEPDLAGGADLPTTVTKVNNILAKLRTAGVIAT